MRQIILSLTLIAILAVPARASHVEPNLADQASGPVASSPDTVFQQHIPVIAENFVGMPFKLGGHPEQTGTTDNSWLFYAIYTKAAQRAGLRYRSYLPIRYLLENTRQIDPAEVRNGDLIVLDNDLAAMVYQVDPSGRMHFIYASEKRQQVIAFHSGNLVYGAYWLEHLKGFFRLNQDMLLPAR